MTLALDMDDLRFLRNVVGRYLTGPDVDDAAQEAAMNAYRSADSFRGDSAPRTWLFRVAANAALQLLRRRKRTPAEVAELKDRVDPALSPERSAELRQLAGQALALVRELQGERSARALEMAGLGATMPAIGRRLGVPENTAKTIVFRARECVRLHLGPRPGGEE